MSGIRIGLWSRGMRPLGGVTYPPQPLSGAAAKDPADLYSR